MSLNLYSVIKSELRVIARAVEAGCSGTEREWEEIYEQIKRVGKSAQEDLAAEKSGYRIEPSGQWSCRECGVVHDRQPKACESCGNTFRRRRSK